MGMRRVNDAGYYWQVDAGALITGKYKSYLQVGTRKYYAAKRMTRDEFKEMKARSKSDPVNYGTFRGLNYWRYEDRWYSDNEGLTSSEVKALVKSRELRSRKRVDEAKASAVAGRVPDGSLRESIASSVRQEVWDRDGGKCQKCGAKTNLQFDHVIPVSLGGANSAANLQILCESCNRLKGASLS